MCAFSNKVINMESSVEFPDHCDRDNYIIMDVGQPVTITAKESFGRSVTFTTYLIRVETNYPTFTNTFSAVRRRYSEFCWIRDKLAANHPDEVMPTLPPKKYLRILNFNPKVIEDRRVGLSKFLQRILETPVLLSDPALLFFLQSDTSVQEMEASGQDAVSLLNSNEISIDPMGRSEDKSISVNNISMPAGKPKLFVRKISTESDDSDRISTDGSCYDSSKADSGHFEESYSGVSTTGSGSLNPRRKPQQNINKPRLPSSSKGRLPRGTFKDLTMLNSHVACYLIGQP